MKGRRKRREERGKKKQEEPTSNCVSGQAEQEIFSKI